MTWIAISASVPVEKEVTVNKIFHSEYNNLNQLPLNNKSNKSLSKSQCDSWGKFVTQVEGLCIAHRCCVNTGYDKIYFGKGTTLNINSSESLNYNIKYNFSIHHILLIPHINLLILNFCNYFQQTSHIGVF